MDDCRHYGTNTFLWSLRRWHSFDQSAFFALRGEDLPRTTSTASSRTHTITKKGPLMAVCLYNSQNPQAPDAPESTLEFSFPTQKSKNAIWSFETNNDTVLKFVVELLERVFLKFVITETDEQLEKALFTFLTPVLLKVGSNNETVKNKVYAVILY